MIDYQNIIQRPHLLFAILLAILAFFLLTLAAARQFFQEEPVDPAPRPVIDAPAETTPTATKK